MVLGSYFLACYPQGGGVWTCMFQFLLALKSLGHDVFWLEVLRSTGESDTDRTRIRNFLENFERHGFGDRSAVVVVPPGAESSLPDATQVFGATLDTIKRIARSSDIVWNFAGSLSEPLLALFNRRAYVDLDPGPDTGLRFDMGHVDRQVQRSPQVGTTCIAAIVSTDAWRHAAITFFPCVELSSWPVTPKPRAGAPFTSITQWTWGEYHYEGRVLSTSKRDAYLRYAELPRRAGRPFELAANIDETDAWGDRPGPTWPVGLDLVDSAHRGGHDGGLCQVHRVFPRGAVLPETDLPRAQDRVVQRPQRVLSRCRPAGARGRHRHFQTIVPADCGFVTFTDLDSALAGVQAIDSDYERHSEAARAFAGQFLDARKNVTRMLDLSLHT